MCVTQCGVAWGRSARGGIITFQYAALENLRILEATRAARERGLNKRLNIPSINFKRCKISANSMVDRGWVVPLVSPCSLSLSFLLLTSSSPRRSGNPESSLKLRGIIGSNVSPAWFTLATATLYSSFQIVELIQPTNQPINQAEASRSLPVAVCRSRY